MDTVIIARLATHAYGFQVFGYYVRLFETKWSMYCDSDSLTLTKGKTRILSVSKSCKVSWKTEGNYKAAFSNKVWVADLKNDDGTFGNWMERKEGK